jgi:hypothetical protein
MSPTATEKCPWCGSTITHTKFVQITAAIREDERKKLLEAEKTLKARIEKESRKQLAEIRQILQKDLDTKLLKKDAAFARERDALQKKIADMTRRIRKGGGDVAEGAELDVFEELRAAFPDDQLTRVKGKSGPIIFYDVRYKGKSAGRILIDATPRAAWQHAFVTNLRQDQTEIAADYAILATVVFPAGKKELFVDSGIIVVAPARVRAMVEVVRKVLIAMHVAKLGDAERSDKQGRLFKFITSVAFKRKLVEASDLTDEALQIDVDEKRAHDLVWKKRGTVLTRIRHVLRDIDTDVAAIVESRAETSEAPLRTAAYRVTSR